VNLYASLAMSDLIFGYRDRKCSELGDNRENNVFAIHVRCRAAENNAGTVSRVNHPVEEKGGKSSLDNVRIV
jgi:hypothetical protein